MPYMKTAETEWTESTVCDEKGKDISAKNKAYILMVDDDTAQLNVAEQMLRDTFRIKRVASGQQALEIVDKEIPDLILLDIHMPEMDGFEVNRRLKEHGVLQHVPVIFISADTDRNMEVRGFQQGAMDYIVKPFIAEIMVQRISRILELNRLQRNLQKEVEKQTGKAEERRCKMERMYQQVTKTLAGTIDAKDKYTNGHSLRVAEYARELAKRLGKPQKEQESIYYMGLLHDIGKIGISEEIINKKTGLTDEEYAIIKGHTVIGEEILNNIPEIPELKIGARWHHERYDGKGYPDGLKGEQIPQAARIIGVADAYDAMTSKRDYRKVEEQTIVRREILRGRGSQFDPEIADKLLEMIDEDTEYHMREE